MTPFTIKNEHRYESTDAEGTTLLKVPTTPRELPSTLFIRNSDGIPAWRSFLGE